MKKYVPVIVVAVVLLVVLGIVIGRKTAGVSPAKTPSVAAAQKAEAQKKAKSMSLMQEAQKAYDAKDYTTSIAKTRELLKTVDNTSQEAKNLLQISQIRMMESAKAQ